MVEATLGGRDHQPDPHQEGHGEPHRIVIDVDRRVLARQPAVQQATSSPPEPGEMGEMRLLHLPSRRLVAAGLAGAALAPAAACGETAAPQTAAPAAPPAPLDPTRLASVLGRAGALTQTRSVIVCHKGQVLLERAFRGPGLDAPVNIKSAAKSVMAALAGAAIDRGVLKGLDQPIAPLLGSRVPAGADPRIRSVTVEHLLSMAAGLEPTSGANYGRWVSSSNWVAYALSRPFVAEPGGRMLYSTGTSHILSAVLTAAAGRSTLELARDWLGEPLDITVPAWPRDPQGIYFGGNEMLMSPRALLRFGEMSRNGGVHAGRRVLSQAWVGDSWRSRGGRSPWNGYTYGLGWWIRPSGAQTVNFAWGYGGQMVYVAPASELTVVITSDPNARGVTGHVQALHALLDEALAG
jgi:CubicO group peptidase (beta-lactamase class C family)